MIERVVFAVLVFLLLFFGGALLLPGEVHVERSTEVARPVSTVFTVLNQFDTFPAWSPWSAKDPEVAYVISGPDAGTGARIEWSGDPRLVGSGSMEIVSSQANSTIRHRVGMDQRRQANSAFTIERIAGGARVTWSFDADLVEGQGVYGGLMSRYFGLLFERWIAPDFEQGLAGLKRYVESLPAADFAGLEVHREWAQPVDILYVELSDSGGVKGKLADAYRDISSFMASQDLERSGQPISLKRGSGQGRFRYEAAIPVKRSGIPAEEPVRWGRTPSGPALRVIHRGGYGQLSITYRKLAAWMAAHGLDHGAASWEQYVSEPATTAEDERVTHIWVLLPGEE